MKKNITRLVAIMISTTLLVSLMSGCGASKGATKETSKASTASTVTVTPSEPVKLTWFSTDHGRILKEGDPAIKEIEKKTNTKLEFQLSTAAELNTKLNVLVASNSLADITKIEGYNIFQYIPQGVFIEVKGLVDKYGPNINKLRSKEAWAAVNYNGKYYGIPNSNTMGKYDFFVRQDWLDNLSIKTPTNIDELYEMLKKFTFNDPDKNGQNDTYGFTSEGTSSTENLCSAFMPIFGAFGVQPYDYFYEKGGKVYAAPISNEYKEAIIYITKLYNEKLIDPDFFIMKSDQALQKLTQGKSGSFLGWWSIAPQVLMSQRKMAETVPSAKWGHIIDLKGKDGQAGMLAQNSVTAVNAISKTCKNPEAVVKLLDFLSTDDGGLLSAVGLENVHYVKDTKGKFEKYTDEGNKMVNEKWGGLLSQLYTRADMGDDINKKSSPAHAAAIENAANAKLMSNLFDGITTKDSQQNLTEAKKVQNDWFVKFVLGKEPISKFDEYVKQWNEKGGKSAFVDLLAEYNKVKAKSLTAGN